MMAGKRDREQIEAKNIDPNERIEMCELIIKIIN